jgi:TRAP-type uncharacterized transport system substrate-binding protein
LQRYRSQKQTRSRCVVVCAGLLVAYYILDGGASAQTVGVVEHTVAAVARTPIVRTPHADIPKIVRIRRPPVSTPLLDPINAGTVTLVSGGIAGTNVRIASDMGSVLDDGDHLRILPVIGKGPVQNLKDILRLRGVDLGLVQSDSLEILSKENDYADVKTRVAYICLPV